jgi:predicted HAD superfamily Cof-like phosphohydrolase
MSQNIKKYQNLVKEFTCEAFQLKNIEEKELDKRKTLFICENVLSELIEFLQPINKCNEDIISTIGLKLSKPIIFTSIHQSKLERQKQLFMDYFEKLYSYTNDFDIFFNLVHKANLSKKTSNGYIIGSNGKILKPSDWKEPDFTQINEFKFINESDIMKIIDETCSFCKKLIMLAEVHEDELMDNVRYNLNYNFNGNNNKNERDINLEFIDAIIDISYYMLDTTVRSGFIF